MKAIKQIQDRKSAVSSGFEKRHYPSFNGDVLNYFKFKERWNLKVGPEKKV